METGPQGNLRTKVVGVTLALCLLVIVWQSIATWYWWPRIRATIENTAALSDSNIALFHQFDWAAVYIPAVVQVLAAILGFATIFARSTSPQAKGLGVLVIICGLAGLALVGFAVARVISDLA